ncbi:MAG: hypothetical protein H0W90_08010 [Actinobacteria bacterium]|nr:hypothetical protein [Actinomycetota bacterium]
MKGLGFYSTAAQIIPVILIVLAFQAQSFNSERLSKWAYWIVLLAFTGETQALVILYREDTTGLLGVVLVSSVLIVLGVLVFLAIVLAPDGFLSMRTRTTKVEREE